MTTHRIERAVPVLPIEDPDSAKRFYVDALGFCLIYEVGYAAEPTEGTIIAVERGTIRLHLDCPMPGHGRDACVCLEVNDADALYEEWHANIDIEKPPEIEPWGARTFTVIDPFGNSLFVVGPLVDPR